MLLCVPAYTTYYVQTAHCTQRTVLGDFFVGCRKLYEPVFVKRVRGACLPIQLATYICESQSCTESCMNPPPLYPQTNLIAYVSSFLRNAVQTYCSNPTTTSCSLAAPAVTTQDNYVHVVEFRLTMSSHEHREHVLCVNVLVQHVFSEWLFSSSGTFLSFDLPSPGFSLQGSRGPNWTPGITGWTPDM